MAEPGETTQLALDVNFPEPILAAPGEFMVDIELITLRAMPFAKKGSSG